MDFIDEQYVPGLQVGEDGRQVAGLGDHRPRRRAEVDPEFMGDDLRQGRLAEPGRPVKKHMVHGFATLGGSGNEDRQVAA